ncbi:Dual oxidase, partial [Dissostichus eleginoides]
MESESVSGLSEMSFTSAAHKESGHRRPGDYTNGILNLKLPQMRSTFPPAIYGKQLKQSTVRRECCLMN